MTVFNKVTGAVAGLVLLAVGIWVVAKYDVAGSLFSTRFMPHQYCYLREPGLIWTNAASDFLIWLSYLTIAVGLAVLLQKTRTLLAFRWVFVAFGLFIVACGFTHFFEMVTVWTPVYWLSTSIKMLTAVASVATAIAFAPSVPRAAGAIRLFREAYSASEEQRAETLSKLLDTEERMKLAVESGGVGTWEHNLLTNELHCDDRCRALLGLGLHREQLMYQDFVRLIHPDDRGHFEALITDALAGGRKYSVGYRVVGQDGGIRNVIARGKPFYNEACHPVRLIGTVIDVTKERQAEETLLKTERLAVAGRMAASIAHEINNPLDAAIGLVYLTRTEDRIPQHVKERLETVEHELNRAAKITQSTLTFYRESPSPVPVNLGELVESILAFQQSNIRNAGVEVRRELAYSQPICAFPGELRQVLTNLVANAVEAMQGRRGKLVIRVHPARDWRSGREGYQIIVADNGPGIPAEARQKLFEPFYTTKGEKGTGLGLWITSQLVQKHGGSVKFRSCCDTATHKSGTLFSVWLPRTHDFNGPVTKPSAA
jgi:PAS domain S-box-containing protein